MKSNHTLTHNGMKFDIHDDENIGKTVSLETDIPEIGEIHCCIYGWRWGELGKEYLINVLDSPNGKSDFLATMPAFAFKPVSLSKHRHLDENNFQTGD